MKGETAVKLARILAKVEAGEKLTAIEIMMLLPYYYAGQIEERIGRHRNK